MDCASESAEEGVDSFEDFVDLAVSAVPCPPTFNDAAIIAVYLESGSRGGLPRDAPDEEFHPDCLCPTDVPPVSVPSRFKGPRPPSITDDNADAHRRACVGIGMDLRDFLCSGDLPG